MRMIWGETKQSIRRLARRPAFSLLAVATLALGIGASTAIFSVVNGVLLNTLPYAEPGELLMVGETDTQGGPSAISWENFRDWQRLGAMFEEVALVVPNSVAVTGDGEPERIRGMFVTASYFAFTGIEPTLGRGLLPGEDEPGGPRTVVLSHGFWQRRFGGDTDVLGRTVVLNNEPHTIVGVMPEGFREVWDTSEAFISLHTAPRNFDRSSRSFQAMARMADGVTLERARDELGVLASRLAEAHPDVNAGRGAWAEPLAEIFAGRQRPLLLSLLAAVGTLLVIACANVASLQLARAGGRVRELAVRAALGGSRARLAVQMLAESLLVATAGGVLGMAVARVGVVGLVAINPSYGAYFDVDVDGRVLAFGIVLALASGFVSGLVPAWFASRTEVASAMREGGRGASTGPGAGRLRSGMVVVQVTLAVALLVGAGLLAGATQRLLSQDMGFEREGLLTLEFRLPDNKYSSDEEVATFFDRLLEHLAGLPGSRGVASADALPFADSPDRAPFLLEGQSLDEAERAPRMGLSSVSPSYFEVLGIPLVAGRSLTPSDRLDTPPVAVISRTAARRLFAGDDPLGRRFYFTEDLDAATIVGVVGDVRNRVGAEPEALVYMSVFQRPRHFASLAVRAAGDPMALAPAVSQAVWALDADQPVWEVMPIDERVAGQVGRERFTTFLFLVFAGMALFLCSLGLYGVMAQSVVQRHRELGVRLALGSGGRRVVADIVGEGLRLTAIGLVLGLAAAALVGYGLAAWVVGLQPLEPTPYGAAAVVLSGVALLAAWLPARRASTLDPARTLREE